MKEEFNFTISELKEMDKRKILANEFYNDVLGVEEKPWLVTDAATLYDFYLGNENELIRKVNQKYGVVLTLKDFHIPFWKLLDFLQDHRVHG